MTPFLSAGIRDTIHSFRPKLVKF